MDEKTKKAWSEIEAPVSTDFDWFCWECDKTEGYYDQEIMTSDDNGFPLCPDCDHILNPRPMTTMDVMGGSVDKDRS